MKKSAMRHMMYEEWLAEGKQLFGENGIDWKLVCPSCGHVARVGDWHDAGDASMAGFSCIGRLTGADGSKTFKRSGGPCNYAGGGLFRLNPIAVERDGVVFHVFDFYRGER